MDDLAVVGRQLEQLITWCYRKQAMLTYFERGAPIAQGGTPLHEQKISDWQRDVEHLLQRAVYLRHALSREGATDRIVHMNAQLLSRAKLLRDSLKDFLRTKGSLTDKRTQPKLPDSQQLGKQKEVARGVASADSERTRGVPSVDTGGIKESLSTESDACGAASTRGVSKDDASNPDGTALRPVPLGKHVLPPLPYAYNALEPYIDEETMHLHHDKHHQSYVNGLNKAEIEMARARKNGDFSLIKHWEREAAFNGAGHYLHTIFWNNMSPAGGRKPAGAIAAEIARTFGGFQPFKKHFSASAEKVEGSGWTLLVWVPRAQHCEILQAEKHQNLSQQDVVPLLVLDVWEHAYYLKYKNDRAAYIKAWWNIVNWENVDDRFETARRLRWQPF